MAEEEQPLATGGMEPEPEGKRQREDEEADGEEEEEEEGEGEGEGVEAKKHKTGDEPTAGAVKLGYKEFGSSVEMFEYFCKILHTWPTHVNLNKYEHGILLDLIKKGHTEPDKKIGTGIKAFVIRYHPIWKNKCFFFVREDKSSDDFSFRKCVDHILPLPDDMRAKVEVNKALGGKNRGGKGGGGRRGGGGRGRGKGRW